MNNLENWKNLQEDGYFENHRCYNEFQIAPVDIDLIPRIKNKVIVEIGCGYGRETCWFSKHATKVYAIEVSDVILEKAKHFVAKHGDISKVEFILYSDYQKLIKERIDFVYSRHVFQHISPAIAVGYLNFLAPILKGEVDILFRMGLKKRDVVGEEPLIEYKKIEIIKIFKKYRIRSIQEIIGRGYKFWRIKAYIPNGINKKLNSNFIDLISNIKKDTMGSLAKEHNLIPFKSEITTTKLKNDKYSIITDIKCVYKKPKEEQNDNTGMQTS